jgi:glutamate N-acetyltransferase/amino-acid N-acetyltransferase
MEKTDPKEGVRGFIAGGAAAGIKKKGGLDLGVIAAEAPVSAAGVFTSNIVKAAPVLLSQSRLKSGLCRAVVANSGCANCCTGIPGMEDAMDMARAVAKALGVREEEVLAASTGVIGQRMDTGKIRAAAPGLVKNLSPQGFPDFVRATMTTDTFPKITARRVVTPEGHFTVLGCAKGAGMIQPDMATMLAFTVTDIAAAPGELREVLKAGADASFNRVTVDGDMSTNDTLLLLASGASGIPLAARRAEFQAALDDVLLDLARDVVRDGEGATKVATILATGAKDDQEARQAAFTIANSPLVKTAIYGADANWGRLAAAAGRAGVAMDPDRFAVWFDSVAVAKDGVAVPGAEEAATEVFKKKEFTIRIDLAAGKGQASVITCDLTHEYVNINASYRT